MTTVPISRTTCRLSAIDRASHSLAELDVLEEPGAFDRLTYNLKGWTETHPLRASRTREDPENTGSFVVRDWPDDGAVEMQDENTVRRKWMKETMKGGRH